MEMCRLWLGSSYGQVRATFGGRHTTTCSRCTAWDHHRVDAARYAPRLLTSLMPDIKGMHRTNVGYARALKAQNHAILSKCSTQCSDKCVYDTIVKAVVPHHDSTGPADISTLLQRYKTAARRRSFDRLHRRTYAQTYKGWKSWASANASWPVTGSHLKQSTPDSSRSAFCNSMATSTTWTHRSGAQRTMQLFGYKTVPEERSLVTYWCVCPHLCRSTALAHRHEKTTRLSIIPTSIFSRFIVINRHLTRWPIHYSTASFSPSFLLGFNFPLLGSGSVASAAGFPAINWSAVGLEEVGLGGAAPPDLPVPASAFLPSLFFPSAAFTAGVSEPMSRSPWVSLCVEARRLRTQDSRHVHWNRLQ